MTSTEHHAEQAEQWARDALHELIGIWRTHGSIAAADYLQSAFAAREADLVGALREISDLHGEINPSNYDHDDACELNRQFVYAITIADAALKSREADLVEAVAELQLAAFLAGRGSVTSMKHGTRVVRPGPTMDDYRRMAATALKSREARHG